MLSGNSARAFRAFAAAQGFSVTGTWMQRIAQEWLVLTLSGGSSIAVGATVAMQFLPVVALSAWGGRLGDRCNRRRVIICTQLGMSAASLVIGCLHLTHTITIWHVYAAALIGGALSAVDSPVRQAFAAELVSKDRLGDAVSLNLMVSNIARVVGPAAGGLAGCVVEAGWTFLINSVSFVVVVLVLLRIRSIQPPLAVHDRHSLSTRSGIGYAWRHPDLRSVLALLFMASTFGMIFPVSLTSIVQNQFGRGAGEYGLLSTALAAGTLLASVLPSRHTDAPPIRRILLCAASFGTAEACVGMAPNCAVAAVLLVPTGAFMLAFTKLVLIRLHLIVATMFRARVMAVYVLCTSGGWPIGAAILGWLAEVFGARVPLIFGGCVTVLATTLIAVAWNRNSE